MTSNHNAEEWYSPMEALALLEARHGAASKALIADKLKDGLIRAHADEIWDSDDPTLNAAWRNRKHAETEHDVVLERRVWRASRHWQFDIDQWRWPENRFVVTRRKRPADRTVIVGLKFFKKDIDQLIAPTKKQGGRPVNHAGWANFILEIIDLERAKKLTYTKFPRTGLFQDTIVKSIAKRGHANKDVIDDDTMKRTAAKIWDKLIAPQKP